jgi:hypothetical protein
MTYREAFDETGDQREMPYSITDLLICIFFVATVFCLLVGWF